MTRNQKVDVAKYASRMALAVVVEVAGVLVWQVSHIWSAALWVAGGLIFIVNMDHMFAAMKDPEPKDSQDGS